MKALTIFFNEMLTNAQENTLTIQAVKFVYLEICSSIITRGDNIFRASYDNNIKFTHSFKQYVKNGKQYISSELFNYFGLDVDRVQELLEERRDYLLQQHHEKFDSYSLSQNEKHRELIYDFKKQIDSEKYLIAEET